MLTRDLYYQLKPHSPWRLRLAARRFIARRKLDSIADRWPISPVAGTVPVGWRGWPEEREFAFVITHDVEGPEGVAKCRKLAELEADLGFRSSFNFVPEGSYAVAPELRIRLAAEGFEVGIHDLHHDGKLYASSGRFQKNAKRINQYAREWCAAGFRSGFMLHNLDWLHELEIEYDASTFDTDPFEPQPEGAGTIFPFLVSRPGAPGYVELPYTLPQDSTLFLVLGEKSPAIWMHKLDWVAQCGGMALVNVHPDYLCFPGEKPSARTFPVEHYVSLLQHVRDRHRGCYWHALPRSVARFMRSTSQNPKVRSRRSGQRAGAPINSTAAA
ncbi:MAG TPA: hypothetical protein VGL42_05460 [Opitutaceae bacterium]